MTEQFAWQYEQPRASLQEQLLGLIRRKHPDWKPATADEQADMRAKARKIDSLLEDAELADALAVYGIDAVDIERLPDGNFSIKVKDHFTDKRLPPGYAYKGGAARSLLLRALRIDPQSVPRDLDVVRLDETEPFPGADDQIARDLMPEDYAHGHGVELLHDLAEYLASRDLTINELLATDEKIIATRACILDNLRGILRLTDFERKDSQGDDPKMMSKILRLFSEEVLRRGQAQAPDYEDWDFDRTFISPFWLALHLDKAAQKGEKHVDAFIKTLRERGQLPEHVVTAEDATDFLNRLMADRQFYFRYAPVEQYETEEALLAEERISQRDQRRKSKLRSKEIKRHSRKNRS